MKYTYIFLLLISVSFITFTSCKKETEVEPADPCPTENMSYQTNIKPILDSKCAGCHNGSTPQGGVAYDNYIGTKASAIAGNLVASIKHNTGTSPMPKNQDKLDDCSISKIQAWVSQGALDN